MNKRISLAALFIFSMSLISESAYSQTSLKFESGGGPSGSGPSSTGKVINMNYGDGGVYNPSTTVTYSLSDQQYSSVEGNSGTPGITFGGTINNSGNSIVANPYYQLMNAIGGSANTHYATGGLSPAINVANDYGIELYVSTDALITGSGANTVSTNTKDIYYGKLTLNFNRPVNNPVIHFTGLGGFYQASSGSSTLGLAAGFMLTDDYTVSRLAGNTFFQVDNNKTVYNSADRYTSNTNNSSPSGASGSVKVMGNNITSLTFNVLMNGDGQGASWSATNKANGDALLISVTLAASAISGTVFNDNNGGIPDGNGNGGVTVNLRDVNGNIVATTTTAADGTYSFANVLAADYTVEIVPPNGFEHVGSTAGTTNGIVPVSLSGANVAGVNFGINQPPVTSDNAINNQAPGQAATIPNILANDNDPNGGTLSPDSVRLIAPSNATGVQTTNGRVTGFTVPGEGIWVYNSNGSVTFTPLAGFTGDPTPIKYTVTDAAGLVSNQATLSVDYNDPVPVSGVVFNDNNGGVPDGNGYGGVTVTLKDANGATIATTTTAPDGSYSFIGIIPGTYTVELTAPTGFGHVGSSNNTRNGITPITVGSSALTGIDFGINQAPVASNDTLSNQVHGTAATLDILGNDTDPNGGTLSGDSVSLTAPAGATNIQTNAAGKITGFTVPGEGAWSYNGDGTATFTPEPGFTGNPTPITYTVTDSAGLESDPATIMILYEAPLPVTLLYFNARAGQCKVKLEWATAAEEKFNSFDVERSADGHSFRCIGKVVAKGNNSKYVFEDKSLVEASYFYRLTLTDADGSFVYSKVAQIIATCDQHFVSIYPNPTPDNWTVDIPGTGPASLELYDISGKKVRSLTDVQLRANLAGEDLAAGVYLLKVTFNSRVSNHQLIKQ